MPVTSLKLFIRSGFIAFFGFAALVVSFVPAEANPVDPTSVAGAAKEMALKWVRICRRNYAPKKCCRRLHDGQLKQCDSLGDKKDPTTCFQVADRALLICLSNVPGAISSPPSILQDPLKITPKSPAFKLPLQQR